MPHRFDKDPQISVIIPFEPHTVFELIFCCNFERRKFIRNTWGYISMFENQKTRVVFLLVKPEKEQYQSAINFENKQCNDIVQGALLDTYKNLTYKAMLGLRWVVENCGQAKFNLKVNDDVVDNTLRLFTLFTTKYSRINHSIFCAQVRPKYTSHIFRGGNKDKT